VAQKLGEEFPRIKTFTTLSPIPGFTQWLTHITPELEKLPDVKDSLQAIATLSQPDWHLKFSNDKKLKESVMALCAYYLTKATQQNLPADSVARFHLGNGARAERLNWLADVSPRGLKNCAGMMVNYVYHLNEIEQNHEAYVKSSELACTRVLRQMAQTCPLARQGSKDKKN
jgi:malonyl-CoA decarboxylase